MKSLPLLLRSFSLSMLSCLRNGGRLSSSTKWPKALSTSGFMTAAGIGPGEFYIRYVAKELANAFHEGWLAYLKELDTPTDHLAWATTKPSVAYLDPSPAR
ncbi:hypothetical protein Acr_00g0074320 [Actinidia rufa]|uniref:Uncharacterized protein n=1 Tax=Actinidia rufa TaxID=165716 RepID=A0A7J0DTN4_9ERIC|nr:hypothetical protein Acr_00g0074320 [Actinidia rufa]